jgi:hypothetical protein
MKKLWLSWVILTAMLCFGATAEAGISVGFLRADSSVPGNPEVAALLAAPGVVDELTSIDVMAGTPTLGDLEDFDVIVLHINNIPSSLTALGNVLADYVDLGGGLVLGVGAAVTGFAPTGRLLSGGYKPLQDVPAPLYVSAFIGTLAGHPITSGILDLEESIRTNSTLTAGATSIGTFDDATYLGAFKGSVMELNFFFQD